MTSNYLFADGKISAFVYFPLLAFSAVSVIGLYVLFPGALNLFLLPLLTIFTLLCCRFHLSSAAFFYAALYLVLHAFHVFKSGDHLPTALVLHLPAAILLAIVGIMSGSLNKLRIQGSPQSALPGNKNVLKNNRHHELVADRWERENAKDYMMNILNCIAEPFFVKDRSHRWVLMNNAHSAFMGYPTEALIGKSDYDIFPKYQADIFWEKDELVFTTGNENINEEEISDAGGVVHIIQTKKSLHSDLNGEKYIVGVFSDITERKRNEERIRKLNSELEKRVAERTEELTRANARLNEDILQRKRTEAALAEEKERLAVTLRSIGDGVIAVDTAGRVLLMNTEAERLSGWLAEDAIGRDLSEVFVLFDQSSQRKRINPIENKVKDAEDFIFENELLLESKDGKEMVLALRGAPINDVEHRKIGEVLVFRDNTEKKLIEEKLATAQKLESVGILAGGIAHDFNNLLTGIFGFLSLAKESVTDDSDCAGFLSKALTALERAKSLTRQLLTFSKGGSPVKTVVSLGKTLKENAQFVLSGQGVDCRFEMPDTEWKCFVDEQQISQVFSNIIINARQAMDRGGVITIKTENVVLGDDKRVPLDKGSYVRISVSDQGPGIPESSITKIFDPFFTTKSTGSGLGLPTAFSIIKKHGGFIDVESPPGEGATFHVYLPALPHSRQGDTPPPTLQPLTESPAAESFCSSVKSGKRILVVDDEDFILELAASMLARLGYAAVTVNNGTDAVDKYKEARDAATPFDLVILDLTMPNGISGVETLALLRALDPSVKALASSGYYDDGEEGEAAQGSFAGMLSKPYTNFELGQALRKLIG